MIALDCAKKPPLKYERRFIFVFSRFVLPGTVFLLIQTQRHRSLEGMERIAAEGFVHADGDLRTGFVQQDRRAASVSEQGCSELVREGQTAFPDVQCVVVQRVGCVTDAAVLFKADDIASEMTEFLQDKVGTHQPQLRALFLQISRAHDGEIDRGRRPQFIMGTGNQIVDKALSPVKTVSEAMFGQSRCDTFVRRRRAEETRALRRCIILCH